VRVVPDDVFFDAAAAQELLHGRPGRVGDAQQRQHRGQHICNGIWWRTQVLDLI
jgi:hypothetical protein